MATNAFPVRLALKELRRGRRKFLFFLLCIAIGVAGLVGVKGFNASLQEAMLKEARTLMAADMTLSLNKPASAEEQQFVESLKSRGIQVALNTETVSMAVNSGTKDSTIVEVKAVDKGYPFYGVLELNPAGELTDETALVGADLLDKLGLQVGDPVRVGKVAFKVAGVITKEPDRVTAGFGIGPRVMLTRGGLQRAELIQVGSRANYIYLFKLASDEQVATVRDELKTAFAKDRPRIADFREANPQVRRFLDRMTAFLSLVSLVALLVGGLGVANATRAYIQQKLDTIAIMKCVGATNRRVIEVYLLQMLLLSLAGSLLGILLGYAVQLVMPQVVGQVLDLQLDLTLSPVVALQGLLVGLVTSVLFTLLPLSAIADVKPALVFRRDMLETKPKPTWGQRGRGAGLLALIGAGLVLIAGWVSGNFRWGFYFMAGLAGAVLLLGAASWGAVWLVRRIKVPRSWLTVRQGLASLYRPGSQVGAIVLALGIGVTMVLSVYLLQRSLMREVQLTTPPGTPNMIFYNLQTADAEPLYNLLKANPGVAEVPPPTPIVRGRLTAIDGKTKEQLGLTQDEERFFNYQFQTTYSADLPPGNELVAGLWWTETDWKGGQVLVSVETEAAERLHLTVGSVMEMELEGGLPVQAKVFNIRKTTDFRAGGGFNFVFAPGGLEGAPITYLGQANVKPGASRAVQRAIVSQFPGVTVIDLREVLETISGILDRIGLVIRFVAAFSVIAGLIILASSIATTKFRRTREAVLFKTLGATRGRVWRIFAVEYAVLGLVAGLMSTILAVAATYSVLRWVMEVKYQFEALPLLAGVVISVVLTVIVGVLSTLDVLRAKPLQVLREE
ncbi:MAG TPA: FtsX-like permease family protein [Symbiobacteriaceae bacterium]|nr:FtsX-like permease family protein [Symbiobacteriaceae bacterium]